jgi:predicted RNA-binding Zn-ribbon protein involved in translation (DUF1610 family)
MSYLECYSAAKDSNARGNIADSLVRVAEDQTAIRFRKRSDLSRTIRMASLLEDKGLEKHSIRDEFLAEFHGHVPPIYISHGDLCINCDCQLQRETDATLICPSCGASTVVQDATSTSVSWNDDLDYSSFCYKRTNHFCDWISTSMAKQNVEIEQNVLDQVMARLVKTQVAPENVNAKVVRDVLKFLKLRRYYEHSLLIACRLTGQSPPRITPEQEEQLRVMFAQIQKPFETVREKLFPDRKNFLSYSYILYKFCENLGLEHFKENFQLLKGRDKLHKQDLLYKEICKELNWDFQPSI